MQALSAQVAALTAQVAALAAQHATHLARAPEEVDTLAAQVGALAAQVGSLLPRSGALASRACAAAAASSFYGSSGSAIDDEPRLTASERLLQRARHADGTLRLVGEPANSSGRDENSQNVLSVASYTLLELVGTRGACALRATCREARDAVAAHPWADTVTRVEGSLALWRTCFPRAQAANVSERGDLVDVDFVHLRGMSTLIMCDCGESEIGDAAFVHLRGLRSLDMSFCGQESITSAIFASLRGIQMLSLYACEQFSSRDIAELLRSAPSLTAPALRLHLEELVRLLRDFPTDVVVARFACRALYEEATEDSRDVIEHDGVSAVIGAMMAHPSCGEVAEHACATLRCLSGVSEYTELLLGEDAVEALIAARALHESSAALARHVCISLRELSEDADGRDRVIAAGGAAAVIAACIAHSGSEAVNATACGAIATIAHDNVDGRNSVNAAGGAAAIVAAMKTFPSSERIASAACEALSVISKDDVGHA